MITIGAVFKGPELKDGPACQVICRLLQAAVRLRGSFVIGSAPAISVVYHVPGSLGKPDFDEMQDARFSRKQQLLMIEVPVPENELNSDSLGSYLVDQLHGANAIAFHYFHDRGMEYPLREAEQFVHRLRKEVNGALSDPAKPVV